MMSRFVLACVLALAGVVANAQSWMTAYESGLTAARAGNWAAARAAFQQAAAYRTEDTANPTNLPGPVTERKLWRNGAPYSPNFLAAYAEYRLAAAAPNASDAKPTYQTAATEFEALLTKGQQSAAAYYYLEQIYTKLGDTEKRMDLEARFAKAKPTFRVDTEVVAPEDLSAMNRSAGGSPTTGQGPTITTIKAGSGDTTTTTGGAPTIGGSPAVGPVATIPTKYALIIGNSAGQGASAINFGAEDAQLVREALVQDAGYAEANVDLVLNATKDQIMASAKALADRVPENATIFIFFAGNGVNIGGKDYLAGVDTTSSTDVSTMVPKLDVYRLFMTKGAKIFAFFEAPRPIVNGYYFGQEIPLVGMVAQTQSTIPGETIYSIQRDGKTNGIFGEALASTLTSIRSNHIPITEFGWHVFNRIRGGAGRSSGGGGTQIPTLPVLTHVGPDESF